MGIATIRIPLSLCSFLLNIVSLEYVPTLPGLTVITFADAIKLGRDIFDKVQTPQAKAYTISYMNTLHRAISSTAFGELRYYGSLHLFYDISCFCHFLAIAGGVDNREDIQIVLKAYQDGPYDSGTWLPNVGNNREHGWFAYFIHGNTTYRHIYTMAYTMMDTVVKGGTILCHPWWFEKSNGQKQGMRIESNPLPQASAPPGARDEGMNMKKAQPLLDFTLSSAQHNTEISGFTGDEVVSTVYKSEDQRPESLTLHCPGRLDTGNRKYNYMLVPQRVHNNEAGHSGSEERSGELRQIIHGRSSRNLNTMLDVVRKHIHKIDRVTQEEADDDNVVVFRGPLRCPLSGHNYHQVYDSEKPHDVKTMVGRIISTGFFRDNNSYYSFGNVCFSKNFQRQENVYISVYHDSTIERVYYSFKHSEIEFSHIFIRENLVTAKSLQKINDDMLKMMKPKERTYFAMLKDIQSAASNAATQLTRILDGGNTYLIDDLSPTPNQMEQMEQEQQKDSCKQDLYKFKYTLHASSEQGKQFIIDGLSLDNTWMRMRKNLNETIRSVKLHKSKLASEFVSEIVTDDSEVKHFRQYTSNIDRLCRVIQRLK